MTILSPKSALIQPRTSLGKSDVSVSLVARHQREGLGAMLLAGAPIGEPIVQHGPFVMSTPAQIMQAFDDYQRGRFLHDECEYRLHTAEGTKVSKRGIDPAYRRGR